MTIFLLKFTNFLPINNEKYQNLPKMPPQATIEVYIFWKLQDMLILYQKTVSMAIGGFFLKINSNKRNIIAKGNAKIIKNNEILTSDLIIYNKILKQIILPIEFNFNPWYIA